MKSVFKLISIALLALLLSACAQQTREVPAEPAPDAPATGPGDERVEIDRVDPADVTDSRNLENPDSVLSQREIFFEFDRADVRAEYLPIIRAHADYLAANRGARMLLEGHADERGSREYNVALGERRGNSVRDLMLADGASSSQIEVISYGEERPVCRQSSEACWERNRRVEIVYTAK